MSLLVHISSYPTSPYSIQTARDCNTASSCALLVLPDDAPCTCAGPVELETLLQ